MSTLHKRAIDVTYALVLPVILVYVAHFLFISNYTIRWTVAFFEHQYTRGIYRYRVLGRWAVLLLTDVNSSLPFFSETTFYDVGDHFGRFSPPLYWAYFQVNAAFFVGSCVIWWFGLKRRLVSSDDVRSTYLALVLAALLGMSVVVPYDMMGYFFLSATVVAYHYRVELAVPLLVGLTVLGTLTRETQFLAIAYAGSIVIWQGISRENVLKFTSITGAFVATYLGLRLAYGMTEAAFRSFELVNNVTQFPQLAGMAAMVVLTAIVIDTVPRPESHSLKPVFVPLVLMSPYLAMILLFAKIDEIRLIIPVEIVLVFFLAWVYVEGGAEIDLF